MSFEGIQNNPFAKAGIYTAYILDGSFFVGLYRLATACYYLAQHTFNSEVYKKTYDDFKSTLKKAEEQRWEDQKQHENERRTGNREVEKQTKEAQRNLDKAKGKYKNAKGVKENVVEAFNVVSAWNSKNVAQIGEQTTKTANAIGSTLEDTKNGALDYLDEGKQMVAETIAGSFEFIEEVKMDAWRQEALRGVVELIPVIGGAIYTGYDLSHKNISVLGLEELAYAESIDELTDLTSIMCLKTKFFIR